MRIGIDLGGSHIAIGQITDGKVLKKSEYNFSEEDKKRIEKVVENFLENELHEILQYTDKQQIEKIGISAPRKTTKWHYYLCM